MADIYTTDIKYEEQDLFFANYSRFLECTVYSHLFEGISLRDIEEKYIHRSFNGWFAKRLLDNMGIDPSGKNKGIYKGRDVNEVIEELMSSSDLRLRNIAWALRQYVRNQYYS